MAGRMAPGFYRVDFTDEPIVEVNTPAVPPPRLERDLLPDEGFTEEPAAPGPIDFPIGPHPPHHPAAWILRRTHTPVRPPTAIVKCRRHAQPQRLVWSLVIVNPQPATQPTLLGHWRGGRRLRGVGFEFAMPLFVRRVVTRTGAATERRANAQADPSRAQLGQPRRAGASPRPPLIRMDPPGQTEPTKQP